VCQADLHDPFVDKLFIAGLNAISENEVVTSTDNQPGHHIIDISKTLRKGKKLAKRITKYEFTSYFVILMTNSLNTAN
jgi:hypothetical protein